MPIVKVNRDVLAARVRQRLKQTKSQMVSALAAGGTDCWANCCNCCSSSGGGGGGGVVEVALILGTANSAVGI
jgi:hypothetical protein